MEFDLVDYHDTLLYAYDFHLFQPGNWLNDSCINMMLCILKHNEFVEFDGKYDFVDPVVVSFFKIQCSDDDELKSFVRSTGMFKNEVVFFPINDNENFLDSSSHW